MDKADNATEVYELVEGLRLSAHRSPTRGISRFYCEHCGGEIPDARRAAVPGCILCVDCQENLERSFR